MNSETHRRTTFESKASTAFSWYQPHLEASLGMISRTGVSREGKFLADVGLRESCALDILPWVMLSAEPAPSRRSHARIRRSIHSSWTCNPR